MSGIAASAVGIAPRTAKRRWGYLVWVIAAGVIGVPEITAAIDNGALPFTTISGMTGHLERHHNWVELIVVALIVLAVFSITRVPPRKQSGISPGMPAANAQPGQALRTPGGRLTLRIDAITQSADDFDNEEAPALFALAAFISLAAIAVGTWAATNRWDDAKHYQPAYVLYGSLGLLWLVVPSTLAFIRGLDMPFPSLFRTVDNLEKWLRLRRWPYRIGPTLALLVVFVIYAGLAILLLHLTLYPYPNITKILNPGG